MKIVMIASEMTPFAKTGGLGDVVAALSHELALMGHKVVTFLPLYRNIRENISNARWISGNVKVQLGSKTLTGELYEQTLPDGVRLAFIRQDSLFDRPDLYSNEKGVAYDDNAARFLFFSKAVVASIPMLRFTPDVLHAHDWQTAFVPLWWNHMVGAGWPLRTIFTIHNLAYQGVFPASQFELTNLPRHYFGINGLEFYNQVNLMKAGLLFSQMVTTVSPRYSQEIQTPEYGHGLEKLLADLGPKLRGVLNGADYDAWSPDTDALIAARYDAGDLNGKAVCKRALLEACGLPAERESAPLIGIVSRLADQKGFDIISEAIPSIMAMGATLVILGAGDPKVADRLRLFASRYPTQFGLKVGFDEAMAHRIEAGADLFLMPSRYEPSGLNQMYSLRYGTVPVVRATGGLADTVQNYDAEEKTGNGFSFEAYSSVALLGAVKESLEFYRQPEHWRQIIQNAMACDFSWRKSALEYVSLYKANNSGKKLSHA